MTNAAARRISFVVPEAIGGAGVEAQAAVNAAGVVGVIGLVAGGKSAEGLGEFALSFFVSERRDSRHLISVTPNDWYENSRVQVRTIARASEASDEAAGREDIVRVESALDALLKDEIFAGRTPDAEFALQFDGTPGDGGGNFPWTGAATKNSCAQITNFCGIITGKCTIQNANAVRDAGDAGRMLLRQAVCLCEILSESARQKTELEDGGARICALDARREFTDRTPEMAAFVVGKLIK